MLLATTHPRRRLALLLLLPLLSVAPGRIEAALGQDDILNKLSPAQIEAQLPAEPPLSYYLYAERLMKAGDDRGAMRWFYVGQLRLRISLQAHPGQDTTLLGTLNRSVGKPLNFYGARHQQEWIAAIDSALAWDAAHDNADTSKEEFSAIYAAQRAALAKLKDFIRARAEQLRAAANGTAPPKPNFPNPGFLDLTADARKSSLADNILIHDLLVAPGGIGMADQVLYPNAKARTVVKIEVITPYDNRQVGVERWTVRHDAGEMVNYIVRLMPDGRGGTSFSVVKDGP